MSNHTDRGLIIAAVVSGVFLILATVLAGVFSFLSKNRDTFTTNNPVTANNSNPFNSNISESQDTPQKSNQPVLIGTSHRITLTPDQVGTFGWQSQPCRDDVTFASQTDKVKWVTLSVSCRGHFVSFYVGLHDYLNGLDNSVISTNQAKEGSSFELKTKAFKGFIKVERSIISTDPDPVTPYPTVFKELVLSVRVQEIPKK
jgi:hypothetical protein